MSDWVWKGNSDRFDLEQSFRDGRWEGPSEWGPLNSSHAFLDSIHLGDWFFLMDKKTRHVHAAAVVISPPTQESMQYDEAYDRTGGKPHRGWWVALRMVWVAPGGKPMPPQIDQAIRKPQAGGMGTQQNPVKITASQREKLLLLLLFADE